MKKYLLLLAIILPFVITSCGDDKDEPKQSLEQQLIGKWVRVISDDGADEEYYIFNKDHTSEYYTLLNKTDRGDESHFTWSLNGNVLTAKYIINSHEELVYYDITIEGDLLTIKNKYDMIFEFHRVKS